MFLITHEQIRINDIFARNGSVLEVALTRPLDEVVGVPEMLGANEAVLIWFPVATSSRLDPSFL